MARWKDFAIATGAAAWKSGAFVLKWGTKAAAKGSVWVIKKVAVDPAAKKIKNWSLVEKALDSKAKVQEMRDLIKNGQCAACGKKTKTSFFGGQEDYCSAKCAQNAAVQFNQVEQVKVPDTAKAGDRPTLVCGCNRLNLYHVDGCSANKAGERLAQNIRWSQTDPKYMQPTKDAPARKMSKEEQRRAEIQEAIRQNPPKKKWHGGY